MFKVRVMRGASALVLSTMVGLVASAVVAVPSFADTATTNGGSGGDGASGGHGNSHGKVDAGTVSHTDTTRHSANAFTQTGE